MHKMDAAEWCEANLGRTVLHEGDEATVRSYTYSDGLCWVTLELPGGFTRECELSAVQAQRRR
jgi:hypothetical protein